MVSQIGSGSGSCVGVYRGSVMVSVQGLTSDLDEISDEIETNGLTTSFGTFLPVDDSSNDAARIDDGGDSDDDMLMMVIVITLGVVVLCMFFGILFYCRQSKKVN